MKSDVIIVGGGAAGCILAARLTEDAERSVTLVEAGSSFTGEDDCPGPVLDERFIPMDYLWAYEGIRFEGDESPIPAVRGKVLGGSTSVNTMIYQRAAPEDYESWGSPIWAYDDLVPLFKRIERDLDISDDARGTEGYLPLRRTPEEEWAPTQQAFLEAAGELGYETVPDNIFTRREGVGPVARNSLNGVRMSTALTCLQEARGRDNLTVIGDSLAQRVLIDDGRATGIEALQDGKAVELHADQVILSAGAIGSPQILTLSGIGPADVLDRLGIPVVLDLPGVGRNLTDHPVAPVVAKLKPGAEAGDARNMAVLIYTAAGSPTPRDMFITLASGDISASGLSGQSTGDVAVSIYNTLNLPDSVGEIEVTSSDVRDLPRIHYRYLESERDRERLREAVRQASEMLGSGPFEELVEERISPTDEQLDSDAALDAWARGALMTALHGTGTCRMGPAADSASVVDFDGRVHGIDGLRVVDLSIPPIVVRSPTNATAMVVAERISDLIRDEQ